MPVVLVAGHTTTQNSPFLGQKHRQYSLQKFTQYDLNQSSREKTHVGWPLTTRDKNVVLIESQCVDNCCVTEQILDEISVWEFPLLDIVRRCRGHCVTAKRHATLTYRFQDIDLKYILYLLRVKYSMLLPSDVVVTFVCLLLKLKHEALILQKYWIYHNQTSLQHLLQNKLKTEYFTSDKLKHTFHIYVYGFEYMNKLRNQSIQDIKSSSWWCT